MPDGYRRGGQVTRNGRTFHRRGTRIAPRRGLMVLAGSAVAVTWLAPGIIGTPALLAVGAVVGVGMVAWRYRRHLRPVTRRLTRWAEKRYGSRNTRPALVARDRKPDPRIEWRDGKRWLTVAERRSDYAVHKTYVRVPGKTRSHR